MPVSLIGEPQSVLVESVNISYGKGEFTRVTLELICPSSFGADLFSMPGKVLDIAQLFKSDKVIASINNAVTEEVERLRSITFKDD